MTFWENIKGVLKATSGGVLIEVVTAENPARLDKIWRDNLSDAVDSVVNHWSPHRARGLMEIHIGDRIVLVDWKHGDRNEVLRYRELSPWEVKAIIDANDRSIYHGVIIESNVIRLMSDRM